MPTATYELEAVQEDESYSVTVHPKHGKPVTLHVIKGRGNDGWRTQTKVLKRDARTGRLVHEYGNISGSWWYVKSHPNWDQARPSFISRHKTKEDAELAANRKVRAYGRMCAVPLKQKAARKHEASNRRRTNRI